MILPLSRIKVSRLIAGVEGPRLFVFPIHLPFSGTEPDLYIWKNVPDEASIKCTLRCVGDEISFIGLHGEPSYMNLNLDGDTDTSPSLSKRELDILKLISEGFNSAEIAEQLFISDATVRTHRKNILSKTNYKNTAQLVKSCIIQGII